MSTKACRIVYIIVSLDSVSLAMCLLDEDHCSWASLAPPVTM